MGKGFGEKFGNQRFSNKFYEISFPSSSKRDEVYEGKAYIEMCII